MLKSAGVVYLTVFTELMMYSLGAPINDHSGINDYKNYLKQYSYLEPDAADSLGVQPGSDEDSFVQAIRTFQEMYNLNVTGEVDEPTLKLMSTNRCGNTDADLIKRHRQRSKRFAIEGGGGWSKTSLTYRISQYPANSQTKLATSQINSIVSSAYQHWTNVTPLKIQPTTSGEDLQIRFASYSHGDPFPFDGPGNVLGHTFFPVNSPPLNGDSHFDDNETWSYNGGYGSTDLLQVATHEFGHALGLAHSRDPTAVMYAYYTYKPTFGLTADDISAIQSLYGPNQTPTTTTKATGTTTTTKTPSTTTLKGQTNTTIKPGATTTTSTSTTTSPSSAVNSSVCTNPKVDAAMATYTNDFLVFQGTQYVRISGSTTNLPQAISSLIALSTVDAALYLPQLLAVVAYCPRLRCTSPSQLVQQIVQVEAAAYYFFQGANYIQYDNSGNLVQTGSIQSKFQGLPSALDSAFTKADNAMYFTAGTQLYRITRGNSSYTVDSGYPVLWTTVYSGIPAPISAAFQSGNFVYIFTGTQYYRTNSSSNQISTVQPPYPRAIGSWWFNCPMAEVANAMDTSGDNPRDIPAGVSTNVYLNDGQPMSAQYFNELTGQEFSAGSSCRQLYGLLVLLGVIYTISW